MEGLELFGGDQWDGIKQTCPNWHDVDSKCLAYNLFECVWITSATITGLYLINNSEKVRRFGNQMM